MQFIAWVSHEPSRNEAETESDAKDVRSLSMVFFMFGHFHPIMGFEYYKNALIHILSLCQNQKWEILYFCEAEDTNDVQHIIRGLTEVFPLLTFEKASDQIADWEQMLLMSGCAHHIIANSTFSWFGAYFNTTDKDKIVCYPNKWFCGSRANIRVDDLFPPSWQKIKC